MGFWSFPLSLSGLALLVFALSYNLVLKRKANKYSPFTEKFLRSPGYTLSNKLDDLLGDLLGHYLVITIIPIFLVLFFNLTSNKYLILIFLPLIYFVVRSLFKLITLFNEAQMVKLGYHGEVYTGQELNSLMRLGAWVYHDIPYKYGNIDHVVVSKEAIYTVETKAYRKFANEQGGRDSKIFVKDDKIHLGAVSTGRPIQQARLHADHIKNYLKKKTGNTYPVIPVVAMPGWFIETKDKSDCLVINPKRGGGLKSRVSKQIIAEKEVEIIAGLIEEYARSVESTSNMTDPDANKKYDFFLNRKTEESKID